MDEDGCCAACGRGLEPCPACEQRPLSYLACPYTDPDPRLRDVRVGQADRVSAMLLQKGIIVFSPLSHFHPIAKAYGLPTGWKFWETLDRAYLSVSRELIVLMLPGWRESVGVTAEIAIAQEMGLPISYIDPVGVECVSAGI